MSAPTDPAPPSPSNPLPDPQSTGSSGSPPSPLGRSVVSTAQSDDGQAAQSLVPSLTKETWELLEFRLWSSFSKKLWVILTSVLTLAGLLGLLGTDAWLKGRVDESLKQQREAFETARATYEARAAAQLLAAGVVISLQERLLRDTFVYSNRSRELVKGTPEVLLAEMRKSPAFRALIDGDHFSKISQDDFIMQSDALTEKQPTFGTPGQPASLSGRFAELRLASAHIRALSEALRIARRETFEGPKVNGTQLIDFYEKKIYPQYIKDLKASVDTKMWVSSESTAINSLQPDARIELGFYLPSAYDAIAK